MYASTEARGVYRFADFELDPARRRLTVRGELVNLAPRNIAVLAVLVAKPGQILPKDTIVDLAWGGVAVSDNSIEKAISKSRQALGLQPDGKPYIETLVGMGYRFNAAVERGAGNGLDLNALLTPHRAFSDGRAWLETLTRDAVVRAGQAFMQALLLEPNLVEAHIGLANVYLLAFEATRTDATPNRAALAQALNHALEACRLDPSSADAWGTLALVRFRSGDGIDAVAAARRALTINDEVWLHHLRLAWVSSGDERLKAALRVLDLRPRLAFAHWFAATVYVARGAFGPAMEHLDAGCAAQDAQRKDGGKFSAVGLHWLRGLVLAAQGDLAAARDELFRELQFDDPGHIYGRECHANVWYAFGAFALRCGNREEARSAFHEALAKVPGHALAAVALSPLPSALTSSINDAIVHAAALSLRDQHAEAARVCGDALLQAPRSSDGWLIPVEPLLNVNAHPAEWAPALAVLRDRAT